MDAIVETSTISGDLDCKELHTGDYKRKNVRWEDSQVKKVCKNVSKKSLEDNLQNTTKFIKNWPNRKNRIKRTA